MKLTDELSPLKDEALEILTSGWPTFLFELFNLLQDMEKICLCTGAVMQFFPEIGVIFSSHLQCIAEKTFIEDLSEMSSGLKFEST
ncbi:hypothetical protein AgCh_016885 [Apium graveolens]